MTKDMIGKGFDMQTQGDTRQIIAKNITFLMSLFHVSRKQLCEEIDIRYTTLCDWLSARSYPRIEALEKVASYFSLEVGAFFFDIEKDDAMLARLSEYARRYCMKKDYSDLYPVGFFSLFGVLADPEFAEPEDLPAEQSEAVL